MESSPTSDTRTPGEIAYAAWTVADFPPGAAQTAAPWTVCSPDYQRAWEAAAQAVLAMQKEEETP
jgi:hypothetical protein